MERAKFNKRVQKPGETMDSFIQDLHKIAADCKFGVLTDELIRDRIVAGVGDESLSEELQSKPDLTLEQAITRSRQTEERKRNQNIIRDTQDALAPRENGIKFTKPQAGLHKPLILHV